MPLTISGAVEITKIMSAKIFTLIASIAVVAFAREGRWIPKLGETGFEVLQALELPDFEMISAMNPGVDFETVYAGSEYTVPYTQYIVPPAMWGTTASTAYLTLNRQGDWSNDPVSPIGTGTAETIHTLSTEDSGAGREDGLHTPYGEPTTFEESQSTTARDYEETQSKKSQDSSLATPDYADEAPTQTPDAASTDATMYAAPSAGTVLCHAGPKPAIRDEVLTSARTFCTSIEGRDFDEKSNSLVSTLETTSGSTIELALSWVVGCIGPSEKEKLGSVEACVESFARIQATCELYPFI